jgi:hypothetical protein
MLLASMALTACDSGKPEPEETPASAPEGTADVNVMFAQYLGALADEDPTAAAEHLGAGTLTYFENVRKLALRGTKEDLEARPLVERLSAIALRFLTPPDRIKEFTSREVAVFALGVGLIGKGGDPEQQLVRLTEQGEVLVGVATIRGEMAQFRYTFLQEDDGTWKVELLDSLREANESYRQIVANLGVTEEEYILDAIERQAQVRPEDSIWIPPFK